MNHHTLCYIVLIVLSVFKISIIEAIPQDDGRTLFNLGSFGQQNPHQPQINPNVQEPCVPHQIYPRRDKRSPHFKKNIFRPFYPVNIYEQHINNIVPIVNSVRPPCNNGYLYGNHKPQVPIQQPIYNNNFWSHFPNIFGGVFGANTNIVSAAPTGVSDDIRPVNEDNDHNNNPNEVRVN